MSMNIDWHKEEILFRQMEDAFLSLGKDALKKNHYELADALADKGYSHSQWRDFITDGRVAQYIDEEFKTIERAEFRKLVADVGTSRSIGQAQIINALSKRDETNTSNKTGPVFVYCFVPMTEQQAKAENVIQLTYDPFTKGIDRGICAAHLIAQTLQFEKLIPDAAARESAELLIKSILDLTYEGDAKEDAGAEELPEG